MKKINTFFLCFLLCILWTGCQTTTVSASSRQNQSASSYYFSEETDRHGITDFDSLEEFVECLTETDNKSDEFLKNFNSDQFVHPYILHADRDKSITVPYLNNEMMELSHEPGFSAITSFREEIFNRPWVWFYSGYGQNYITVKIMYLDDVDFDYEGLTCSEVVAKIAPNFPNVNHNTTAYELIYEGKIQLADRKVSTLIHKNEGDLRLITSFVYDNMFVRVVGKPGITDEKWFGSFSIKKIPFDQIHSVKE